MKQFKKRLARGETEAFVELYDQLGDRLLRYLSAKLNPTDAQDVLQDVFVRLVRYKSRLGKAADVTGYVFLTARNEAIRWSKKNKNVARVLTSDSELPDPSSSGQMEFEQTETVNALMKLLSDESREVVQLKIYSGLTFAEIGSVLKMPTQTAASRYRRAISKMQSSLEHPLAPPSPSDSTPAEVDYGN